MSLFHQRVAWCHWGTVHWTAYFPVKSGRWYSRQLFSTCSSTTVRERSSTNTTSHVGLPAWRKTPSLQSGRQAVSSMKITGALDVMLSHVVYYCLKQQILYKHQHNPTGIHAVSPNSMECWSYLIDILHFLDRLRKTTKIATHDSQGSEPRLEKRPFKLKFIALQLHQPDGWNLCIISYIYISHIHKSLRY